MNVNLDYTLFSLGLSKLSEDYCKNVGAYPILRKSNLTKSHGLFDYVKYKLCLLKLGFPHECCDTLLQMWRTKKLPSHQTFYSSLTEENITSKVYTTCQEFWNVYECENLLEYGNFYIIKVIDDS